MILLGISGHARSGKDTVGKYIGDMLSNKLNEAVYILAYAGEIKGRLMEDLHLNIEQMFGDYKEVPDERYPMPDGKGYWTPRQMMQQYGSFMRSLDYDFWVKKLFDIIEERCYTNVIITDVRHKNEVDAVVNRGGLHIRVVRDFDNNLSDKEHISETALDDNDYIVNYTINNDGSLEDLFKKTDKVIEDIIRRF